MPKVSIIIPTYNSEKYLRECLDSAVNQTLKDIEIIIIDSASTDKTLDIVNEFSSKDERIVVVKRPKEFVGLSRNAALEIAKGDYVMFCDSDDFLEPTACEDAYNQIKTNDNDMVYFAYNNFYEDAQKYQKVDGNIKSFSPFFNGKSFYLYEINKPFISGSQAWYKIYKKSFLDKHNIRFGTEKFLEDASFYIKCIINSTSVSVLNKYLYNYRKTDTSSSTTCAKNNWKDVFSSLPNCYKAILSSEHKENYLKTCLPYFINSAIYWYSRWSKIKGISQKEYYEQMHNFFKLLAERHLEDILLNKNYINEYKLFKHFSKENWETYNFLKKLETVLSVRNNGNHKVFNLFGVKIKIKRDKEKNKRKSYKKMCKYYAKNIKRIKEKVAKGEKIRVAFYVNDSRWKSQNLYNLLLESKHYVPFVLVGRHSTGRYDFEYQTKKELDDILNYYKNKNMEVYSTYDYDNNCHIALECFTPDIIFYSRPFGLAAEHSSEVTSHYALSCYIPYFISNSPTWLEADMDFQNNLWRYFIINQDLKNEYAMHMANKGENLSVVGYPLMETYLENVSYNKTFVIYAPHCSLGNHLLKYATFDWNGKEILEFAKAHPEINWVFKPHPILKGKIVESGFMTEEEVEEYWSEWDKIGIKYEGPDYLDLFKQSKAMITDCGSFLAEYMPTKNPVILLRSKKATPYNFLAKKVTKYYYSVWNLEQLYEQLEKVLIQGRDPWKERRLTMLESLHLVNNASQNIINEFNKEFGIEE